MVIYSTNINKINNHFSLRMRSTSQDANQMALLLGKTTSLTTWCSPCMFKIISNLLFILQLFVCELFHNLEKVLVLFENWFINIYIILKAGKTLIFQSHWITPVFFMIMRKLAKMELYVMLIVIIIQHAGTFSSVCYNHFSLRMRSTSQDANQMALLLGKTTSLTTWCSPCMFKIWMFYIVENNKISSGIWNVISVSWHNDIIGN
jgi:hypothetical protein